MKILITGGAGFIGSALAIALAERGDEITVLDNLSPQIHGENPETSALVQRLPASVRFVTGDVRDRAAWAAVLAGQEVVVHLAAETGTGQSMYEIDRYVDVNARGTSLLLDILAKRKLAVNPCAVWWLRLHERFMVRASIKAEMASSTRVHGP